MCGSLILLKLVIKYSLHCFVANSLLSQFTQFLGKLVLVQTLLVPEKKIVFFPFLLSGHFSGIYLVFSVYFAVKCP